jgi:hypothetical protein
VLASAALAQPSGPRPPTIEPERETRAMAIFDVAGTQRTGAVFSVGGLGQISLQKQRILTPPECDVAFCIESPRIFGHGLGAFGVTSRGRFAAQAQLGFLYKTGNATVPYAGLVGQYLHPHDRAGPALRVEIMDNLGFTAGWVFGEGNDGFYLGIDLYHSLLKHVGLF